MALHSILGRSAARVKPVVTRLVSGQRTNYHTRTPTLYSGVKSQPSYNLVIPTSLSSLRRYSAAASPALKTPTGYDRILLKVIELKIDDAEEDEDDCEVVEEPYRFPFVIEDIPGKQTITLTRIRPYRQGETMNVEVHMPIDEEASESYTTLVVKVVKSPNFIFEFGCTAYPDEISIDSLSVTTPDSPDHANACEGSDDFPSFKDLDDDLQKAFLKYLEVRGINTSTTSYLHEYMIRKEKREYSDWLKTLKKVVQA
ncbi:Mitochondrial glycoprotein family protein [Heracleum sosnowskyi]|uniref:Mitochondrial glycoprotein family protein n=1 Tax=Heracleum sosnowskyi TaxID=360622 RepID=A0AAD8M9W1_9APIA|nr:Mitochondrial glycoprotein family protein [Heracleum sosnowskyi]